MHTLSKVSTRTLFRRDVQAAAKIGPAKKKWVRARMPTIGSKPVPVATLDARGRLERDSRKGLHWRGVLLGKWLALPMLPCHP